MQKNIYSLLLVLLGAVIGMGCTQPKSDTIDLSGEWQVRLESPEAQSQPIMLPGTTDIAGIGIPDTLQPRLEKPQVLHLTRRHSFVGEAFYTRLFDVPEHLAGQPMELTLERVLWKSTVSIDGVPLQPIEHTDVSLVTPHRYTLPQGLRVGRHSIEVCVDNRKQYDISVKELCHSYTDDTQVKWNGILGRMELRALPPVSIDRVEVYPDETLKKLDVLVHVTNHTSELQEAYIMLLTSPKGESEIWYSNPTEETLEPGVSTLSLSCNLPSRAPHWSEIHPDLLHVTASVETKAGMVDKTVTVGLRNIASKDGKLLVNGEPIFLRGTLECCVFPLTGCPPTDKAGWQRVFGAAREWGLNHLRFHSWCPPEAAFEVADSMGFYLGVELPVWATNLGSDAGVYDFLRQEYESVIRNYGNHPSFCLLSVGNELQYDFDFLNAFVADMRVRDPRHLYTTTSFTFEKGHGGHPEPMDQYFVTQWTDSGWVRGQGVFDAEPPAFNKDYDASTRGIQVPIITHEIGQYAVYPDVKEIDKYTGSLDPLNLKAVRADLERKGLLDRAEDWLQASGHLAALLYKEEIERAMKTQGISGYQLLGLQDFPGQGTALVGLVNAFWESKHVVEPAWFRQFCAPVVPLASFEKAVYRNTETFVADLQLANYSGQTLIGRELQWALVGEDGTVWESGSKLLDEVPNGGVFHADSLRLPLSRVYAARALKLRVAVSESEWCNEWPIWVYPLAPRVRSNVVLTASLKEAESVLAQGGTVILSPKQGSLDGLEGKFLPVFWSPVHFPKQAGTMGIWCNPEHPAFLHFPTENFGNWQWWRLVKRSTVIDIDSLQQNVTPLVECVDNFMTNRRLATVFETKVGEGRLLFSGIDLLSPGADSPEIEHLVYSLFNYASTDAFAPQRSMTPAQLRALFGTRSVVKRRSATSIYE
jgi:hypothetical protein